MLIYRYVFNFLILFSFIITIGCGINKNIIKNDTAPQPSSSVVQAIYLSDLSNINDFSLFANNGWDGGWFVGYNKCWVQEIQIPMLQNISRVFIGAKLGRMKVLKSEEKPAWESASIPGIISIALSSSVDFKKYKSFDLVSTEDIPFEGLPDVALNQVGESRWFWIEVPLNMINFGGINYLAVFSTSKNLQDGASSPILAAGWDIKDKSNNTFLFDDTQGSVPKSSGEGKSISYFDPALAIKLIPANAHAVSVHLEHLSSVVNPEGKQFFSAAVSGINIEKTWIDISLNGNKWERHGRYLYTAPFIFTLDPQSLPKQTFKLRAVAQDELGNTGFSNELELLNQ